MENMYRIAHTLTHILYMCVFSQVISIFLFVSSYLVLVLETVIEPSVLCILLSSPFL